MLVHLTEASGGLGSGELFDKAGTQRLVLTMGSAFRGEEETGIPGKSC
jgi:hypothetical protein